MLEKMWEVLEKLAKTTGVAVEKLYVILEQQAKTQLVLDILTILGIICLIIGGIYVSRYFFKKYKESRYADWETPMILSGIITGVTGFLSIFFIIPELVREIVQILVNPPVWILEYVMNLIK